MRSLVLAKLREILIQDFRVPADAVVEGANIRSDLWLDSISLVDLFYLVQKDFGFEIEIDEFRAVHTIGEFVDLIVAKTSARRAG